MKGPGGAVLRLPTLPLPGLVLGGLAASALALRLAERPGLAALTGMAALAWGYAVPAGARLRLALGLAFAGLLAASAVWPTALLRSLPLLPALGDLLMAAHFGATLRPGRVPLITAYTYHDPRVDPLACAGYTRALTAAWALLFLALAPLHALLLLGLPPFAGVPAGPVMAASGLAMLALFLAEHPLRDRLFPQFGPATPLRTLRAVLAAHLASPSPSSPGTAGAPCRPSR